MFVKDKADLKKCGWKGFGEADEPRQEILFLEMHTELHTTLNPTGRN